MKLPYIKSVTNFRMLSDVLNQAFKVISSQFTALENSVTNIETGQSSNALTELNFVGNASIDNARALTLALQSISAGIVYVSSTDDTIYFNSNVNVPSNVHLIFKCPVTLGRYGGLRIQGSFEETPDSNLPKLRQDSVAGTKILYCGVQPESIANNYAVGDRIIIRGLSDGNGQAVEIQECTVASVDLANNNITVEENLEYSFKASYPPSDYERNFGNTDFTFITFLTFTKLLSDVNRGDTEINIENASKLKKGDYLFFGDDKVPADIAGTSQNTYRHEVNKIISISGNTISLENALCHDYETSYNAYITKMDMVENASIRGARINYRFEPNSFTVNAFTMAYTKDCWIENCVVENEGFFTSKGHGFRIDRAINCHTYNCAIYAPKHVDAAEGYGFTIYRANGCSHNNAYAKGCRHSFLLFRGASHNQLNNIFSVNCRVSDIDFHGGDEYANIVDGFTIIGGNQKYGTNLAAIKFGNESHVSGCNSNIVRNGIVADYKGFGIDFVPISSDNVVENITFRNIERLIRCVDLSRDSTLEAVNNTVRNCVIDSPTERLGTIAGNHNGGNSHVVNGLTIENCIFKNTREYFRTFNYTKNCKILNNKFFDGIDQMSFPDPVFLRSVNSINLHIEGNIIQKGNEFIKITNSPEFVCKNNKLYDFYGNLALDDVSGNDNYIFAYNDFERFSESYLTSGGGSTGGKIINKFQAYQENFVSDKTFPLDITTLHLVSNSAPVITDGDEILNYTYTPKNTRCKLKIEVYVPSVYTDTIIPVGLSIWKDSICVAANSSRIPTSGQSNAMPFYAMAVLDISDKTPFGISARMGPNATATITLGGRFSGLAKPVLVITEMSPN